VDAKATAAERGVALKDLFTAAVREHLRRGSSDASKDVASAPAWNKSSVKSKRTSGADPGHECSLGLRRRRRKTVASDCDGIGVGDSHHCPLPLFDILPIIRETAECYSQIRHELKTPGTPIPGNDLWIAALAASSDATRHAECSFPRHSGPARADLVASRWLLSPHSAGCTINVTDLDISNKLVN